MNNRLIMGRLLGAVLALLGTAISVQAAAQQTDSALLERGEYLTQAADCLACHVTEGGKPYAGGLAVKMPFGAVFHQHHAGQGDRHRQLERR
jgi:mono/diheme cytochrome c family protein